MIERLLVVFFSVLLVACGRKYSNEKNNVYLAYLKNDISYVNSVANPKQAATPGCRVAFHTPVSGRYSVIDLCKGFREAWHLKVSKPLVKHHFNSFSRFGDSYLEHGYLQFRDELIFFAKFYHRKNSEGKEAPELLRMPFQKGDIVLSSSRDILAKRSKERKEFYYLVLSPQRRTAKVIHVTMDTDASKDKIYAVDLDSPFEELGCSEEANEPCHIYPFWGQTYLENGETHKHLVLVNNSSQSEKRGHSVVYSFQHDYASLLNFCINKVCGESSIVYSDHLDRSRLSHKYRSFQNRLFNSRPSQEEGHYIWKVMFEDKRNRELNGYSIKPLLTNTPYNYDGFRSEESKHIWEDHRVFHNSSFSRLGPAGSRNHTFSVILYDRVRGIPSYMEFTLTDEQHNGELPEYTKARKAGIIFKDIIKRKTHDDIITGMFRLEEVNYIHEIRAIQQDEIEDSEDENRFLNYRQPHVNSTVVKHIMHDTKLFLGVAYKDGNTYKSRIITFDKEDIKEDDGASAAQVLNGIVSPLNVDQEKNIITCDNEKKPFLNYEELAQPYQLAFGVDEQKKEIRVVVCDYVNLSVPRIRIGRLTGLDNGQLPDTTDEYKGKTSYFDLNLQGDLVKIAYDLGRNVLFEFFNNRYGEVRVTYLNQPIRQKIYRKFLLRNDLDKKFHTVGD